MIFSRYIIALMLTAGLCTFLRAQVNPPELLCLRSDTLFWNPAVNSCGTFLATEVYTSTLRNGPYSLLTRITDPGITFLEHKIAGQNFYYLLADFSCPGETAISSDTLDNRDPSKTVIDVVSVESEGVRISWFQNTDPETIGYVIYRTTDRGTTPIDTVFDTLEYLDIMADPTAGAETYNVVALDACGNQGAFDISHSTIHLTAEDDFCNRRIALSWENYSGWQSGIENNQIWWGSDGGPIGFEHQVGGADTLAGINAVVDDTEYCIQIVSKKNGSTVTSQSNLVCIVTDVLRPLEELVINNVTVNSANEIEIHWTFNADADLDSLIVSRGVDTSSLASLAMIGSSTSDSNILIDPSANIQDELYYYTIHAVDACGTPFQSNVMSSLLLELDTKNGDENLIDWSPLYLPGRSLLDYSICKIEGNVQMPITNTDASTTSYVDIIPSMQVVESACYVVKASHTDLSGGDMQIARSNTKCIDQKTQLYVPNAFVPNGNNSIFKPEFVFESSIVEYTMRIFNRWGGQLFTSPDPQIGWDGKTDGTLCEAGTYLYTIELTLTDGSNEVKSGTVHLLR